MSSPARISGRTFVPRCVTPTFGAFGFLLNAAGIAALLATACSDDDAPVVPEPPPP